MCTSLWKLNFMFAITDFLFLDEATSAMDPDMEEKTFLMLLNELDETAIVSVAHRQSMEKYHNNVLNIINKYI